MVRARVFVSVAVVLSVLGPAKAFGQQPAAAAPPAAQQTSTPTTRLTAGIEQASLVGRTSATYWLVDFFLDGPLTDAKPVAKSSRFVNDRDARFYDSTRVWLNARLSGGPATADSKLTSYVGGLDLASAAFKPQELARSVQLSAGLQFPLKTIEMDSVSLNGKRHDFHVAFIVGGGVESPVYDASAPVPIYEINDAARAEFPAIATTHTKLAFVQADRSRYYHRWLAGLRLRTYAYEEVPADGATGKKKKWIGFPGQLDFTIGQSEVLSGGSLNGLVMNAEGFYLLPLASNAVYLFGAVAVHLTEDDGEVPRLLLKAAGEAAAITDADVYVHYVGTPHRDLWKIGVAVDLLKLFTKK